MQAGRVAIPAIDAPKSEKFQPIKRRETGELSLDQENSVTQQINGLVDSPKQNDYITINFSKVLTGELEEVSSMDNLLKILGALEQICFKRMNISRGSGENDARAAECNKPS